MTSGTPSVGMVRGTSGSCLSSPGLLGSALTGKCEGCYRYPYLGGIIGLGVGAIAGAVHDWLNAHIDF